MFIPHIKEDDNVLSSVSKTYVRTTFCDFWFINLSIKYSAILFHALMLALARAV